MTRERLAIFDVDYTLTKRETLFEFYVFLLKKDPKIIKHLPIALGSAFFYVFKIFDAKKAKEYFISFIDGIEEVKMKSIVKDFYEERLSKIIYKDAFDKMKELKNQGCKVYLISASAEFYLNELYSIKEVDQIIGTKFTCTNGMYNRSIVGNNCKGEEKVKRLFEHIQKEKMKVDFKNSYMFSDSLSDLPLFNLVGNPYLINFKGKNDKIKKLKWK